MSVRQNENLTTEQIKAIVKREANPFDEEFDAYIASVPHGRPMPPEQEPAHQALLMDAAKAVLKSALVENDIDPLVRNIAAHLPVSSDIDDLTLRRLAREILTQRVEQLNVQGNTLNRMANARPISPPAVEPKNSVTVEFEVDRDTYDRLTQERLTAKVGDVSPLHAELRKRVDEEIAAGRIIPDGELPSSQSAVRQIASPQIAPEEPKALGPLISKAWPLLRDELVRKGVWAENVAKQNNSTLALLIAICGDRPLASYALPDMGRLQDVMLRLPSKYAQGEKWSDLYRAGRFECIAEAADASEEVVRRLGARTWNRHLGCINTIWETAHTRRWTPTPKSPFNVLHLDQKKGKAALQAKANARPMLESEDLELIFRAPLFTGHGPNNNTINTPGPHVFADFRYWGIALAAYSGMREGEIAHLLCRHIRMAPNGSYFICLDPSDGWLNLKEVGSVRIVPIHSDLIRLGLIEYCVKDRNPNHFLISTEPMPKDVAAQKREAKKLTNALGKFFNGTFKKHLGLGERKVFHSFRHTVQTNLARADVSNSLISEIIGHADPTRPQVSAGYFHGLTLAQLAPAIEKMKLPIDIDRLLQARRLSAAISKSGGRR